MDATTTPSQSIYSQTQAHLKTLYEERAALEGRARYILDEIAKLEAANGAMGNLINAPNNLSMNPAQGMQASGGVLIGAQGIR